MINLETAVALKKLNDKKRAELKTKAGAFANDYDKFACICSEFLRNYTFDYTLLLPENEEEGSRGFKTTKFYYEGKPYWSRSYRLIDPDEKYSLALSPSIHALKTGTCASFSAELEWFAKEFNVKYNKLNEPLICYDELHDKNFGLRPIMHYYVVLELNGVEYKVDVAGAIMAMDYKKKHQEANISPADFLFVDKNSKNPFDKIFEECKFEPGDN